MDFDFQKLIQSQKNSTLSYGSEFGTTHKLDLPFKYHPNWPRIKHILENSTDTTLKDVTDEDRKRDLEDNLKRGNHKSTQKDKDHIEFLKSNFTKEVSK